MADRYVSVANDRTVLKPFIEAPSGQNDGGRPVALDPATGKIHPAFVPESALLSAVPGAHLVPQAGADGRIALGWLPVAANGEVSEAKLVRADDSRLGNPTVGGDLSGSAAAATVVRLRGRPLAPTAPAHGQALTWDDTAQAWGPTSGASGAISVGDGTTTVAEVTTVQVSPGTLTDLGGGQVVITTGGGTSDGERSPATRLLLFHALR